MSSFFDLFFSWNATIVFSIILICLFVWEFLDKKNTQLKVDYTEKKDPYSKVEIKN